MNIRWRIADYLSRTACWLRGHEWYVSNSFYGVPGNVPSELQQQIWVDIVTIAAGDDSEETRAMLQTIDERLINLSQLAGANWGHIWPKKP